jgi:8-oxo-dGTP pyrophosphatase MutT (NUDIX family)
MQPKETASLLKERKISYLSEFWRRLRNEPVCERKEELEADITKWNGWAKKAKDIEGRELKAKVKMTFVSGIAFLRTNQKTKKREVLLVHGRDSNTGKPKEFWQFTGGKVGRKENHLKALQRELKEELGIKLGKKDTIRYNNTYTPWADFQALQPDAETAKALTIHSFVAECAYEEDDSVVMGKRVTRGGDVDEMVWTSDPFVDSNGVPRVLTEQTDAVLRQLGFTGPANKNTCSNPLWDGDPTRYPSIQEKFWREYRERYDRD